MSWPTDSELNSIKEAVAQMSGRDKGEVRVVVAPYRICPLGAHIDHQGGTVSAMTINKGILLGFVPSGDTQVQLRSAQFEGEVCFRVDEIQHPIGLANKNGASTPSPSKEKSIWVLKPGGYFFGITPDSSTIWAKYQKNVEAYHNRSGAKPNVFPNYIRSESYMITFELEEEKFPLFGKRYQLKFSGDNASEDHCLVHFPSLIRLAREAGLEFVEIQSLTDFYDDNRAQFASLLMNAGPNFVDPRGKLLPRAFDLLGLYATFIFQKPDPDIEPPLTTPIPFESSNNHDERELPVITVITDASAPAEDPSQGLGKIVEQKGILGPGPADLRFSEAI